MAFNRSKSMASTSGTSGCIPDNAFQEMAPSASAMVRSSTLIQKPSYDIFINHRGPDVKKTLASRIYNILDGLKVTVFLDSEELEYGDFLPATLEATIRSATLHIAIFSKSYAESPWCLAELSYMLKSGAKIIPIFYHVEPTDLRYVAQRKGMYIGAFDRHIKKRRYSREKLQEWKDALYKVSFYTGEIIKNNDDEMRLFKNIVNIVLKEISNLPLEVAKHPVGLDKIVKDFEYAVQCADGDQGVQIVGIWGMGGSGKTTLAKELYNKRSLFMESSSFIFDIREAKGVLHNKQIQFLKDFGVNETFDNVNQGKAILARYLRSSRVLIVMDDVDHAEQLDSLLPTKDNLGRGSLIIVTTREHQVLTSCGISSIYKMRAMDRFEAEKLFCWHAFLQPSPIDEFQELVEKFVNVCNGSPLSLKVLGGQLYGNSSKQYWQSLFHKISRILPGDIKKRLQISYDDLDDEEKEAFLDIACFFVGEKYSLAIDVWDGSGWSGLHTWERLLNKCLVELDNFKRIRMHDHLRDLGKEIATQHSPSRLWLSEQVINHGKQIEKIKNIRGIKLVPTNKEEQLPYREALTPYLIGLKLLEIRGDFFNEIVSEISRELVWLRWSNIGHRNLPAQLSLKNLRVLELYEDYGEEHHLEELWEAESDAPMQLRELFLSECWNVRSLPEEFCRLQFLEQLTLSSCVKLLSLPDNFGDLTNLQYLSLSFCGNLRSLPVSCKNLMLLQHLDLMLCHKLILMSDDFQNITKLEYLNLGGCHQLDELPHHITNQAFLIELDLSHMKKLRELPIEIGQLRRLRKMMISNDWLISLPNSLGDLSSIIATYTKHFK